MRRHFGSSWYDSKLRQRYRNDILTNIWGMCFRVCSQYFVTNLHIVGLAQDCSNSTAKALELLQCCTKPSICFWTSVLASPTNQYDVKLYYRSVHCEPTMMTSSNWNIFRVTGPLCGEFTGPGDFPAQRPVTRSFDVFFHLRLNKRLSKQSWGWWFETLSCPLWRHSNDRI